MTASTASRNRSKAERASGRTVPGRTTTTTIRLTVPDRRAVEAIIEAGWARNLSQAISFGLHIAVERIKANGKAA